MSTTGEYCPLATGMNVDPSEARRVIDVEQWAEIRRLHNSKGVPIKESSRRLGVARNTVRSALSSAEAP